MLLDELADLLAYRFTALVAHGCSRVSVVRVFTYKSMLRPEIQPSVTRFFVDTARYIARLPKTTVSNHNTA